MTRLTYAAVLLTCVAWPSFAGAQSVTQPSGMSARPPKTVTSTTGRQYPVISASKMNVAQGPGIHTIQQALGAAYSNNPTLLAQRAATRATDENVPAQIANWRPQILLSGGGGRAFGTDTQPSVFGNSVTKQTRNLYQEQATVTQPLYRGGRTVAGINRAEDQVMSQRATLQVTEQQVFTDTIAAYVGVISNSQVLQLDVNDEQVLAKQLQATNDRFRVGEITRTDVAQAEAALSQATATREAQEGALATSRANFQRETGELPGDLLDPQPLVLPAKTEAEVVALSGSNNPNVVAALFADKAAREAFNLAYGALLPSVSLQGSQFYTQGQQQAGFNTNGQQVLGTVSVPIYQGGMEYAAIRQARQTEQQARKQLDDQRRAAVQQAVTAFENYVAARATIASDRVAIRANEIALEGVQREAIVGSRTTLDVLNAEQTLLNSRVTLVQALANYVTYSYSVANAVGRLTAYDLNLAVPLYDVNAYYRAVKNLWIGTGDFATDQPGR